GSGSGGTHRTRGVGLHEAGATSGVVTENQSPYRALAIQERFSLTPEATRSPVQPHPLIATAVGCCLLAAACGSDSSSADGGDATVVATTAVMGDVVENMVGDLATVEVLMPRGADPHDF